MLQALLEAFGVQSTSTPKLSRGPSNQGAPAGPTFSASNLPPGVAASSGAAASGAAPPHGAMALGMGTFGPQALVGASTCEGSAAGGPLAPGFGSPHDPTVHQRTSSVAGSRAPGPSGAGAGPVGAAPSGAVRSSKGVIGESISGKGAPEPQTACRATDAAALRPESDPPLPAQGADKVPSTPLDMQSKVLLERIVSVEPSVIPVGVRGVPSSSLVRLALYAFSVAMGGSDAMQHWYRSDNLPSLAAALHDVLHRPEYWDQTLNVRAGDPQLLCGVPLTGLSTRPALARPRRSSS